MHEAMVYVAGVKWSLMGTGEVGMLSPIGAEDDLDRRILSGS